MNQILYSKELPDSFLISSYNEIKKDRLKFSLTFFSSTIIFVILFIYFCLYIYNISQKEKNAKNIVQSFSIESLYNNNLNYRASPTSYTENMNINDQFVIGLIEIDKIGIHYPILSSATEEALKIAPCRFAGPMPNSVGNLCIAGHNYLDKSFFGKLKLLDLQDELKIYDIYGNSTKYVIYYKSEIDSNDLSCTSQKTYGKKIVTLMTCNSLKDTRLIYTAKEIL